MIDIADGNAADANVVVIGGANIDVKCRTHNPAVMRTSNPGTAQTTLGGVGRNIAENLARLGITTRLISAVGGDASGDRLIAETGAARVNVTGVLRTEAATGSYTAVFDPTGELVIAVACMDCMDALTAEVVVRSRDAIESATVLILDCNVARDALACAARIAHDANVPIIVDPVSGPKAEWLRALLELGIEVHTITPNAAELAMLLQGDVSGDVSSDGAMITAAEQLHSLGVRNVWIRLGARGSYVSSATDSGVHGERIPARTVDADGVAHILGVVDVTGAGDAMLAGYVYAMLRGKRTIEAARYGQIAAAMTVASDQTVSALMSPVALRAHAAASRTT
ncbi:MAG: carbohydrate kinase family protein [Gemmatimonadaceae bacterium]